MNLVADDAGLASGLFNTAQQVGGSLGLAILSTLAANQTSGLLQRRRHRPAPRSSPPASRVTSRSPPRRHARVGAALLAVVLLRPRHIERLELELAPVGAT